MERGVHSSCFKLRNLFQILMFKISIKLSLSLETVFIRRLKEWQSSKSQEKVWHLNYLKHVIVENISENLLDENKSLKPVNIEKHRTNSIEREMSPSPVLLPISRRVSRMRENDNENIMRRYAIKRTSLIVCFSCELWK